MVPNSRTPVRGVSIRNDGNPLRAVWQIQAGLLPAQTQVFQRHGNRTRSPLHRQQLPIRDARNRRSQTLLADTFCVW